MGQFLTYRLRLRVHRQEGLWIPARQRTVPKIAGFGQAYFCGFLLTRNTEAATAAMMTAATPTQTVIGRFANPDVDELEPTVTWTAVEWEREPLVAVTLIE